MTSAIPAALPARRATYRFTICCAHLLNDERGQDLVEYALIAATIGLGTIAGMHGIAASISNYMAVVGTGFDAATAATV